MQYHITKDATGHPRVAGPRKAGCHRRVYDFWPEAGENAVCVCLDCWRAWPEGSAAPIYQSACGEEVRFATARGEPKGEQ